MTNGKQLRAQIDAESVRALLLGNGGAAVALLAFLPNIQPAVAPMLGRAVVLALLLFQFGLAAAMVHNHLRRRCSLAYDLAYASSPRGHSPCTVFGWVWSTEPCVCMFSWWFMWLSLLFFLLGGITVFFGAMLTY
jgi:hypothetical protein